MTQFNPDPHQPLPGGPPPVTQRTPAVPFWREPRTLSSWLFTLDHKRIGVMYLTFVLVNFLLGGVFALLVRFQLLAPKLVEMGIIKQVTDIMSAETYNRMFTLHGAVMVFLVIIPSIPASLGNIILPLQLGAKDVAFPRLNLMSLYIYVIGAVFAIYSMVTGAVDTGWTFYTPYSALTHNSVISMTLAVFILGFSSIFTGLNFIVTIHTLRAPGMTFFRMPLFIWALYATSVIQVLATPVLAITLLLLMAERVLRVGIFDPAMGGDPILFQHFFWFYSHPAVYIMIVPGMGVVSELLATFSRKPIFGYSAVAYSSVGIAIIGFLVWGHHMFVSGQSVMAGMIFSFLTFLVAIPTAIKVFNWTATMYKGDIHLDTPMLYALAFLFVFTVGGLTGIFLAALATDVHLTDTYFVVAHFHYVMMGGTIFAFFGALHYWWPKITGRMYSESMGRVSFIVTFIGFNTTFFIQFFMGAQGMPRRYYNYLPQFTPYHTVSTIGSWILGTGFMLTAYCLLSAMKWGKQAPDNPWNGTTLEWHTSSPPPTENFTFEPVVTAGPYDRP